MKRSLHLLTILTVIVLTFSNPGVSLAQDGSILCVDPESINVDPGQSFSVDIAVENVADLYGFDVTVHFDNAYLTVVDAEIGDFLEEGLTLPLDLDQINASGKINFVNSQMGLGTTSKSGSGTLFTIHFTAHSTDAVTQVDIDENLSELTDNIDFQLIPFTAQKGTVIFGEVKSEYPVYFPLVSK